jgi:hypothetical protein
VPSAPPRLQQQISKPVNDLKQSRNALPIEEVIMSKAKKRNYNIENDLRRYLDGIRLHPYLGHLLINGWRYLVSRYPDCTRTRWEFARSAVPVLQRAGLIELVDPSVKVPKWLVEQEVKLVNRGKMRPIWMLTPSFPGGVELWMTDFVAEMCGGEIVWAKEKRSLKHH